MSEILLAGGSGMIGSKLVKKLKQKNYNIVLLSTKKSKQYAPETMYWNPEKGEFPELDLSRFSACFNFCGAGIFDQRFTEKRKATLRSSRIMPINFLREQFQKQNAKLPHFISTSACGFYPNVCLSELNETSTHGQGFISSLVDEWEKAAAQFNDCSERVSILRIGIVMAKEGGFLKKLVEPMKFFAGAVPGNGKQSVSWIHIDDLCEIMIFLMENKIGGTFNAVGPKPETLGYITRMAGRLIHRPVLLPNIPVFMLRLIFGKERYELILTSQNVSSEKITGTGFSFRFKTADEALRDLLN